MRALVVMATLFFSLSAFAQSQPPPPSAKARVEKKNSDPLAFSHQSGSKDNGGDRIAIFEQLVASPEAAAESEQQKSERAEHSSNERGLTFYTGILAAFTVLLAFVAGVQAWFFWVQLGIMKKGIADAAIAARAAEKSAMSTISRQSRAHRC